MLDYDKVSLRQVLTHLNPFVDKMQFRIYETSNGFHVFVVSHLMDHQLLESE